MFVIVDNRSDLITEAQKFMNKEGFYCSLSGIDRNLMQPSEYPVLVEFHVRYGRALGSDGRLSTTRPMPEFHSCFRSTAKHLVYFKYLPLPQIYRRIGSNWAIISTNRADELSVLEDRHARNLYGGMNYPRVHEPSALEAREALAKGEPFLLGMSLGSAVGSSRSAVRVYAINIDTARNLVYCKKNQDILLRLPSGLLKSTLDTIAPNWESSDSPSISNYASQIRRYILKDKKTHSKKMRKEEESDEILF